MFNCLYYWIIAPLRGGVVDTPDRSPAFRISIVSPDSVTYELRLYCDQHGIPEFARCRIPDLAEEIIPDSAIPILQSTREHLLSILRITFRPDAMLAEPSTVYAFIKEGAPEEVKLLIEELGGQAYDPEHTKNLFLHTFDLRESMRLYVDGCDARIPLQYRYLSFYKLLELRFRKDGHWNRKDLSSLLDLYAEDLKKQGFNSDPYRALHELRDKCAHIKTGKNGKKETHGVTYMNVTELARVESLLPVLRAACAKNINERANGKFALKDEVILEQYRPVDGDA